MTFVMFMLDLVEISDLGIANISWKGNEETERIFIAASWDLPLETKVYIVNTIHDF